MFVREVAGQLSARGHEVTVFGGRGAKSMRSIPGGGKVLLFPYIDRDRWRKLPVLNRQYTLTKLLERLSMLPFAVPGLIRGRYDVVHIQKPYDLPVALIAKASGSKLLFGCHGKDFWLGDRTFIPLISGSVAASKFNARQVKRRYGIDPVVVYNGVDLELFSPVGRAAESDLDVLGRFGLEPSTQGRPVLLYAGRLIRWKGVEYLIKALKDVQPGSSRVWIAGEGTYRPELEALTRELGVEDRVTFLGAVEQADLVALYRSCSMLVATSFVNETFGMALCEAMACGTPVVASDFGGFREVVVDGLTGFLFKPQDAADLARKVNVLLADPELSRRMGLAGRDRVVSTFSWSAVADRLEEVYRCVAPSSM